MLDLGRRNVLFIVLLRTFRLLFQIRFPADFYIKIRFFIVLLAGASFILKSAFIHASPTPYIEQNIVSPGQILEIPLKGRKNDLMFELDGVDVTALVEIGDNNKPARLQPSENLKLGKHILKVYRLVGRKLKSLKNQTYHVEFSDDLPIDQGGVGLTASNHIDIHGDINAGYTITKLDEGNPETLDGNIQIETQWGKNNWSASTNTNVLLDSTGDDVEDIVGNREQRAVDINDFLVKLENGNFSSQVGDHQIKHDGLLMYDFYRRGVSANWHAFDKKIDITGFSVTSRPFSGSNNGLGSSDKNNHIIGSIFRVTPFDFSDSNSHQTEFGLTWLRGNHQETADVAEDDIETQTGSAWSVFANTKLLKSKLEMQAEVARSTFDENNTNNDVKADKDDAYTLAINYQVMTPDSKKSRLGAVDIGVRKRRIGTFFKSLANSDLISDLDSIKIYSEYNNQGFSLQGSIEEQTNNSNKLENIPTLKTTEALITANYTFSDDDERKSIRFLGKPSLGGTLSRSRQKTFIQPVDFSEDVYQETSHSTLFANFTHEKWDWNVNLTHNNITDYNDATNSGKDQTIELGFNVYPNQYFSLNAQWQYSTQTSLNNEDAIQQFINLSANAEIIPQKLNVIGSLSWDEQYTGETLENLSSHLNLEANWTPNANRTKKPKMTYWLRGQYTYEEENLEEAHRPDTYQILMGFSVSF